jgi:tetratricopeptide (TPR) repeat protein
MAEQTRLDTKRSLKQDHFLTTTGGGLEWAGENRRSVIVTTALLLAAIIVVVLAVLLVNHRSNSAAVAFGEAMQTYEIPLAIPGEPIPPGEKSFPDAKTRAAAACTQFRAVADQYGMMKDGKNARYFVGVTQNEQGQTASAEATFKQVSGSWNSNVAALAKLALADLYHQSGRDPQAIDLYNQLTDKPTDTVPYGLAQLQLAALYTDEGKISIAHDIYAKLKDKDAKSAAGTIAAQKLNPQAAPAQPGL